MPADSNPDNAPDRQDTAETASAPESFIAEQSSNRGRLRQIILIGLLALMLAALAYDYRVARPSVERAFDQIVKLNDQMNLSADPTPTLNTHIHKEIGRDPSWAYTEGPYRVEVFSWTAGLPFRTHDLYAVYVPNGNDLIFMRHYKFALPDNELDPPRPVNSGDGGGDAVGADGMPAPPIGMGMDGPDGPGGPGGPGGMRGGPGGPGAGDAGEEGGRPRRPRGEDDGDGRPERPSSDDAGGRPQRPSGEGQDESPAADEGSPTTPAPAGDSPTVDTPPSDPEPSTDLE